MASYFDNIMKQNEKIADTEIPAGALGYADYVKRSGTDIEGQLAEDLSAAEKTYNAAVKDAAIQYDRAVAGYGQKAENMAQAGLTGGGYSDYVTASAYAAKQGSIDLANQTKQQSIESAEKGRRASELAMQKGYLDYVENYKTQKKADTTAATSYLISNNIGGEGAVSYLKNLGFGDDEIKSITGITDPIVTEHKTSADFEKMDSIYTSAINQGLTGEEAFNYAKSIGGLNDEQAREIANRADAYSASNKQAKLEQDRQSYIERIAAGEYTLDQALTILTDAGYSEEDARSMYTAAKVMMDAAKAGEKLSETDVLSIILGSGITDRDAALSLARFYVKGDPEGENVVQEVMGVFDSISADENKKKAYNDIIERGLMGEMAIKTARELYNLSEKDAKELVALTDAFNEAYAAANPSGDEDITIDIGGDELGRLKALYQYAIDPNKESGNAFTVKYGNPTQDEADAAKGGAEAFLDYLYEYYIAEGYSEAKVERLLELVTGSNGRSKE